MTVFHLVRSFGGKRLGGAERNIYNLVKLISLNLEEENIVLSERVYGSTAKNIILKA